MAISLNNFSVPRQAGGNEGLLMPKLKYRFRVAFSGFGGSSDSFELTKQVVSCGRPSLSFENVELHVYNSKINYAGKYTWGELQIVIRDDVANSVSKLVARQLQKQFDFYEQASATNGSDYKFQTDIELLDGGNGGQDNNVLERFECYGCYIQKADYQQGDYKTSDPMDITLTLKFDNALQTDKTGPWSLEQQLARTAGGLIAG